MKRRNANRRGDAFNEDDKATCNEIAQGKERTMDKGMDKEGRVDKERVQGRLQPKEISRKKQSQTTATHLFPLHIPQTTS